MKNIIEISGYSQAELANKFGISQPRLNQYLSEKREPDLAFIVRFCDFFHITPNHLLGYADKPIVTEGSINITEQDFRDTIYTAYTTLCDFILTHNKKQTTEEIGTNLARICYNAAKVESSERKGIIKGIVIGLYDDTHKAG